MGPWGGPGSCGDQEGSGAHSGWHTRSGPPEPQRPCSCMPVSSCSVRWDARKPRWRTRAAAGAPGPPTSLQGSSLVGMQVSPQDRAGLQTKAVGLSLNIRAAALQPRELRRGAGHCDGHPRSRQWRGQPAPLPVTEGSACRLQGPRHGRRRAGRHLGGLTSPEPCRGPAAGQGTGRGPRAAPGSDPALGIWEPIPGCASGAQKGPGGKEICEDWLSVAGPGDARAHEDPEHWTGRCLQGRGRAPETSGARLA